MILEGEWRAGGQPTVRGCKRSNAKAEAKVLVFRMPVRRVDLSALPVAA